MKYKQLFLMSFLILLIGCNNKQKSTNQETPENPGSTESLNTNSMDVAAELEGVWILETLNKEIVTNTDAYKIPSMRIVSEEGRVVGNAGCNKFEGSLLMKTGNTFSVEAKRTTELECPETDLESVFLNALSQEDLSYKLNEKQLIFYNENNSIVFKKSK